MLICRNDFAGKIFKVIHDKQRGPLCLVRCLNGKLKKSSKVISSRNQTETIQRIYEPLADEYREIGEVHSGDVAILAGLKVIYNIKFDILVRLFLILAYKNRTQ